MHIIGLSLSSERPLFDAHLRWLRRASDAGGVGSAIKAGEAVARQSGNHVKVKVEDVLTTVLAVVLANRNAIGRAHGLHCGRDARKCRHQRACKSAVNVIDPHRWISPRGTG